MEHGGSQQQAAAAAARLPPCWQRSPAVLRLASPLQLPAPTAPRAPLLLGGGSGGSSLHHRRGGPTVRFAPNERRSGAPAAPPDEAAFALAFKVADADGDGRISADEARQLMALARVSAYCV